MDYQVLVLYENGVLRLLEPLDLPEHSRLRVTVSTTNNNEQKTGIQPDFHPTRSWPLSQLEPLINKMSAGGDALHDSEALYEID